MAKINSRAKGKTAERELIGELKRLLPGALTDKLERNLTQTRNGGHDILGLDGWAIEVKRYAEFTPADMVNCWEQTVMQARNERARPALCYRADRREWRAVVRASDLMQIEVSNGYMFTMDMSLPMFARIVEDMEMFPRVVVEMANVQES